MAIQTYKKTMGLEDYLKNFHGPRATSHAQGFSGEGTMPIVRDEATGAPIYNKWTVPFASEQYWNMRDEVGSIINPFRQDFHYYDPAKTTLDQWKNQFTTSNPLSAVIDGGSAAGLENWGGGNNVDGINRALAEHRGVNSGRFGRVDNSDGSNVQQWAPIYDPATGQVTYQVQEGGDEYGGLAMGAATGLLGGMGAFGNPFGDLFSGFGGGSGSGATGAFDMGIGGVGESMGLGGGFEAPWGVKTGGGMDLGDWQDWGQFTDNGGGMNLNDIIEQTGNFTTSTGGGGTGLQGVLDWIKQNPGAVKLGSTGLQTLLGMFGADQKADSLKSLNETINQGRAPYLNTSLGFLNNPQSYFQGPGKAAVDANLRALSSTYGNPIDSPTALGIATDAGLRNWQNAVLGFGGLGTGGQGIQAQLGSQQINSEGGVLDALGYGLETIFNPKKSALEQLLESIKNQPKLGYSVLGE